MNRHSRRIFRQARMPAIGLLVAMAALHSMTASSQDVVFPAHVQAKLQGVDQAKLEVIGDSEKLRIFGLTPEKLIQELERRDPEQVDIYITALTDVVEQFKVQPGDMEAIPLNTETENFRGGRVLRPAELDERQREPGPISLHRYVHQKGGIPTFANAPVAVRQADLIAGNVEVAFIGVPLDMSSGWRNSKHAPRTLRAMYGLTGSDINSLVDPSLELNIVDYGDVSVDNMSSELTIDHVREIVREIAETGAIPFVVGGDQTLMYPNVAGVTDIYGSGNVTVVHLDSHYQGVRTGDHTISDDQVVSRLVGEGLVPGSNFIQLGLRGPAPDAEAVRWMRSQGIRYYTMAQVERDGWDRVLQRVLRDATRRGTQNVYVSINASVIDTAYVTAAGRPVPGGLTMREVLPLMRRLCAETNVVGFELLDMAPILDPTFASALNLNSVMHACLTGVAMRKVGLDSPRYFSPLSVQH